MSTKIYDGFRMKNLDANKLVEFINETRTLMLPVINEKFCESVVNINRKIIFQCIEMSSRYDGSQEVTDEILKQLRYWYENSSSKEVACKGMRDTKRMMDELSYEFVGGVENIAIGICKSETAIERMIFSKDLRCNLAFLKGDEDHLLFIPFGDAFCGYLREAVKSGSEYAAKYGIEEYGYWNNTDKPDNISKEEWNYRDKLWREALPGIGRPVECGICTTEIIDQDKLFNIFCIGDDGRAAHILEMMPSVEEILREYAHKVAVDDFVDNDPKNTTKWNAIVDLTLTYTKMMKDGTNKELKDYAEKIFNKLYEAAPKMPMEEIISSSVLTLLPKIKY